MTVGSFAGRLPRAAERDKRLTLNRCGKLDYALFTIMVARAIVARSALQQCSLQCLGEETVLHILLLLFTVSSRKMACQIQTDRDELCLCHPLGPMSMAL